MVMFASILTKAIPQYKVHQGNERQGCLLSLLSTIKAGFRAGAEIVSIDANITINHHLGTRNN